MFRLVLLSFIVANFGFSQFAFSADIVFPQKAKSTQFTLANGLNKCLSPNTTSDHTGFHVPSCNYEASTNPCQLTPDKGAGKLSIVQKSIKGEQNLIVKVAISGLEKSCNGQLLFPVLSLRVAMNDCNEGQWCVLQDINSLMVDDGSNGCIVENEKCKFEINLVKSVPDYFPADKDFDIQVLGCGVGQRSGNLDQLPISCGTFLK